jgi:hypothetical protein
LGENDGWMAATEVAVVTIRGKREKTEMREREKREEEERPTPVKSAHQSRQCIRWD